MGWAAPSLNTGWPIKPASVDVGCNSSTLVCQKDSHWLEALLGLTSASSWPIQWGGTRNTQPDSVAGSTICVHIRHLHIGFITFQFVPSPPWSLIWWLPVLFWKKLYACFGWLALPRVSPVWLFPPFCLTFLHGPSSWSHSFPRWAGTRNDWQLLRHASCLWLFFSAQTQAKYYIQHCGIK